MKSEKDKLVIAAVGDIGLIGDVRKNIIRYGNEFPFTDVKDSLNSANLVFGNLEMPFSEKIPDYSEKKSSEFWADPQTVQVLKDGGFSILSFANNHTLEQGEQGVETTINLLEEIGIKCVGAGKDLASSRRLVVEVQNDIKIGFLAYAKSDEYATNSNYGPAPLNEKFMIEDIQKARSEVDVLIVSLHFGMIYMDYPSDEGRALCRRIIDSGANIILGHHPHVLQGIEEYNNGLIAYSLGEFIFDPKGGLWYSELGRQTRKESIILLVEIDSDGYHNYSFIPVWANEKCQPVLAKGKVEDDIRRRFNKITNDLKTMTPAQFYEYAGKRMVKYELNAFIYHLKRFNILYFISKISKMRARHFKLLLGFIRKKLGQF